MITYTELSKTGGIAGSSSELAEADLVLGVRHDGSVEVIQSRHGDLRILVVQDYISPPSQPKRVAICQKWEESERGWGVRSDGYSVHLTEDDRAAYIAAYWDRMPSSVPDEYERPAGVPYICEIDADLYQQLAEGKNQGLRFYDRKYPSAI